MLTVSYVYSCDFCRTVAEAQQHVIAIGGYSAPVLPNGWSTAFTGRVACPQHRVVVVDRDQRDNTGVPS